jgi:outer membrane protein assembly factor BamB
MNAINKSLMTPMLLAVVLTVLTSCGGGSEKDKTAKDKPQAGVSDKKAGDSNDKVADKAGALVEDAGKTSGKKGAPATQGSVNGWVNWRGPYQNGTSDQGGLPTTLGDPLWTYDMAGRGSVTVSNGKLFGVGYIGETDDLREILFCLEAETGKEQWRIQVSDFFSDVIYNRYAVASPTVDPDTGNLYWMTTARDVYCVSPAGKIIWQFSGPERFGWNTYPNGRTGAAAIDGDLVIFHSVSNNWGKLGPPADRFFAFDKRTGESVWTATAGEGPPRLKDSSFSTPYFAWLDGKRVFYAGDGSGNIVCINARTGEQVWRYPWSFGGINSSVVLHKGMVVAVHGKENLDSSDHGGMIMLDPNGKIVAGPKGGKVLDQSAVKWVVRHKDGEPDIIAFTSSPVLVGDTAYVTVATGELVAVDMNSGKRVWHKKLATDQIHASPLYSDGKLFVPMNPGDFYIMKPGAEGVEELAKIKLEGNCLGAPAVWNGKIYVHSTGKLYCFGKPRAKDDSPRRMLVKWWPDKVGPAVKLQVIPDEVLLRPGSRALFRVQAIDANGHVVTTKKVLAKDMKWASFIPPTAKVKAKMDGAFNDHGELTVAPDGKTSAGAFKGVAADGLAGVVRGRVMTQLPYTEDFESYEVSIPHKGEEGIKFSYPPLAWAKARFVWEVREVDGNKVLAKTMDRLILQRGLTFIGHPKERDYTFQTDVMTDGSRRLSSDVGIINQRYIIKLRGNYQQLVVECNQERLNVSTKFKFDRKKWYTLKSRIDVNEDGSGKVLAKAWERGTDEPEAWTIQVPVAHAHTHGAPGLFGFAINGKYRVYVDNIKITPNQ